MRDGDTLMDGILIVDKPAGWTSSDVVGFVRGRSRVRRVGHAGTLDPAATGLLPLLLGQATRLTDYLMDATKIYVAEVELGVETDTYDAEGEVMARRDASTVTRAAIEALLPAFTGDIEQTPPAFSALKRDGVPLYKRARRGETIELRPRPVRVNSLRLLAFEPPRATLEVDCGKGFYVRSLAHDLGRRLGTGAMLAGLVRTRVGPFRLKGAVALETLRDDLASGAWQERVWAPDEVLLHWDAVILGEGSTTRLRHGNTVALTSDARAVAGSLYRAYSTSGDFLAIVRAEGPSLLRAEKVFLPA